MVESINEIVKRGSIYLPSDGKRLYIKRLQIDSAYETDWLDITNYVISFGTISVGFPDGIFIGEYNEEDFNIVLNNNKRIFNKETDPDSIFFGYKTRYRTKFKLELYASDKDDNSVLLRAFYGISINNPTNSDNGEITFTISSLINILKNYNASGIDQTSATTAVLVTRLLYKTQNGLSIFDQYFEGYSINPDSVSCMTISHPTIDEKDTVLDKLRDYSFYQDFFYYVDNNGYFVWDARTPTSSTIWELNGGGQTDSSYGTNIVSLENEYDDIDNTYTRVTIEYAENGIVTEKTFSGIRNTGDSASLSDANSTTIFNWLKSNNYLDSATYRVSHLYVTSPSALNTYLASSWSGYELSVIATIDKLLKSDSGEYTKQSTWSIGDGSVADIYGDKIFSITKKELILSEATTVATRIYNAYKNNKMTWEISVYGLFQLYPKDKLLVNYIGEINVSNPFILGISELGGGDVLGGRTGSIRIVDESVKLESISINLDNYDINIKVRQVV